MATYQINYHYKEEPKTKDYELYTAKSPEEANKNFEGENPDLVVDSISLIRDD